MDFRIVEYKKYYRLIRLIIGLSQSFLILYVTIFELYLKKDDDISNWPFITMGIIGFSFKLYYGFISDHYKTNGQLTISNEKVLISGNPQNDPSLIRLYGYEKMSRPTYLLTMFVMAFTSPKSGRGESHDGINYIQINNEKNTKTYFIINNKADYENLQEIISNNENLTLKKLPSFINFNI